MIELTAADVDRFWAKVDRDGPVPAHLPELGPCWVWTAYRYHFGHGAFRLGGRNVGAHRVAYVLAHGQIAPGLMVRHLCNNPPCCNARHLAQGTQKDNMADRDAAGRHGLKLYPEAAARGERNGAAKLTSADVVEIRALTRAGEKRGDVATRFGITKNSVTRIVHGHRWAHVGGAL